MRVRRTIARGRGLDLTAYFETDDGSLPEIEVAFDKSSQVVSGFELLIRCGGKDVTAGGGASISFVDDDHERPFAGAADVELIASGRANPLHIVLRGITSSGCEIPDLGVLICPKDLVFDYRMGPEWKTLEIMAFMALLRQLCVLGGKLSSPWWDSKGEQAFITAIGDLSRKSSKDSSKGNF
jgi:hypothetical protein